MRVLKGEDHPQDNLLCLRCGKLKRIKVSMDNMKCKLNYPNTYYDASYIMHCSKCGLEMCIVMVHSNEGLYFKTLLPFM